MHTKLPPLRRKRRVDVPGLVGRFLPHIAAVDSQVEPYAQAWDDQNHDALAAVERGDGPLWVALGDSSTQSIGADTWEQGWVLQIRDRLRDTTGQAWQVINLAMSGGRFSDVADKQVNVMRNYLPEPDLTTCVIGSNDMMWRRSTDPVVADAAEVVDAIPDRTLLSRLGGPGKRPRMVNDLFAEARATKDVRLFSIWDWPGAAGALAVDRIHPSNLGYEYMADLVWTGLETNRLTE